jgi:hypothetical protein
MYHFFLLYLIDRYRPESKSNPDEAPILDIFDNEVNIDLLSLILLTSSIMNSLKYPSIAASKN